MVPFGVTVEFPLLCKELKMTISNQKKIALNSIAIVYEGELIKDKVFFLFFL